MNGSQQALEQACAIVGLDRRRCPSAAAGLQRGLPPQGSSDRPGLPSRHRHRSPSAAASPSPAGCRRSITPQSASSTSTSPSSPTATSSPSGESVSDDGDQFATTPEIAEILARLHRLNAPADLDLPPLDPFANAAPRIDATAWLTPDDRAFLTETLAELQDAYASLEFVLPQGVIHGDASIGNVLRDRHGSPGPDRPGRLRHRPARVGPDPDGDVLRQLRLAHPPGVRGLRPRLRLRHHAVARLSGPARDPRVPHGHLADPESRRRRAGSGSRPPSASTPCAPARAARTGSRSRRPPRTVSGRAAIRHSRDCIACSLNSRTAPAPSATARWSRNSRT